MAVPEDGNLLRGPSNTSHPALTRSTTSYIPHHNFSLAKEKQYQQQFADMYFYRLAILKPAVEKVAGEAWDGFQIGQDVVQKVDNVLGVRQGNLCWIIGTIFMDMPLKPNILDDISKDDKSGRIRLVGHALENEMLVTGCIVAVMGTENSNGEFEVVDIKVPGLPPQSERWVQVKDEDEEMEDEKPMGNGSKMKDEDEDMEKPAPTSNGKKIAIVSGLGFSSTNSEHALELNLLSEFLLGEALDPVTQENVSQISRLIIAGNSIAVDLEATPHDTIGNTKKAAQKKYGYDSSAYNPTPTAHLDDFLVEVLRPYCAGYVV
ncbi:putative DNA polymerase subunit delta-2 [Glarea lozoyensis 74030]|uniref:Putative DNA polymerase subunit delta-2 n=1 Tax=Glarea lozoyensis (strain ATCC 74030 / MF5533) TaxID=1104152 RepID=H0EX97_GLAL7|nr:putative DNA polymerase subunit delta-2 [Glarea lozoyensis 74030]